MWLIILSMRNFNTSWKSADGLEIFAQGWEPEDIPIKGVVCLIHGIGEHTGRFAHVAKALTDAGYVLMGADWRGHGRSAGKRGHVPSMEAILKDIDRVLAEANHRYEGLPLFLYGQSLGAIMVLYYSLKRKPLINGIIATSPALHTSLDEQPVKLMAARILGSVIPGMTLHSGLVPEQLSRDSVTVQAYIDDPMVHYRLSLGFGKKLLEARSWTLEHAPELELPLLLMHGKADKIAYPSGSIDFAAPIDEKCTLVLWDEAFHELHNEPERAEVFEVIITWLDKLL